MLSDHLRSLTKMVSWLGFVEHALDLYAAVPIASGSCRDEHDFAAVGACRDAVTPPHVAEAEPVTTDIRPKNDGGFFHYPSFHSSPSTLDLLSRLASSSRCLRRQASRSSMHRLYSRPRWYSQKNPPKAKPRQVPETTQRIMDRIMSCAARACRRLLLFERVREVGVFRGNASNVCGSEAELVP